MLIVSRDGKTVINTDSVELIEIAEASEEMRSIKFCCDSFTSIWGPYENQDTVKRELRKILDAYAADYKVFYVGEENK